MILHCVFCGFRDGTGQTERLAILSELERFSLTLDGVLGFDHGPNADFENRSPGITDGFVIRFQDRAALRSYADHPTHRMLGDRLRGMCRDGEGGLVAVDLVCAGGG